MTIKNFKNIIFDLGGVILNIDEQRTVQNFARLSNQSPQEILTTMQLPEHKMVLQQYETGRINTCQFRQQLSAFAEVQVPDEDFDEAWNMVLMDIPKERIELLQYLGQHYRLFLLSNTNDLHWRHFNHLLKQTCGIDTFDDLFEKTYYSFQLEMRKPDPEIYQHVLADSQLQAAQTVMFDDLSENLKGAATTGIHTYEVTRNQLPLDIFYE